jgi:hypothetical protein
VNERAEFRQTAGEGSASVPSGFFNSPATAAAPSSGPGAQQTPRREAKPSHYKVICISMYTEDLKRLDGMVESLKSRGLTKANRSALIRYALGEVDLDKVPKGL